MKQLTTIIWLTCLSCTLIISSCKKLIEIDPPIGQLMTGQVLMDDATATAALSGIYGTMASGGGETTSTFTGSCVADETLPFGEAFTPFYNNNIPADNLTLNSMWTFFYKVIYQVNFLLEGLAGSSRVSPSLTTQMTGELKWIRAFCYFELVNYWGEVPLQLTPDVKINMLMPRSSISAIYAQMISDLKDAQSVLSENYPAIERVRVNKAAATALLARVYLYNKNYGEAESESSKVINNSLYGLGTDFSTVFIKNSREAILQCWTPNGYTAIGNKLIPAGAPNLVCTPDFMNAFEKGDRRRTSWIDSLEYQGTRFYYPVKYKLRINATGPNVEYVMVLRLAEQYLIRAEARIKTNKISEGVEDLNVLRTRARATPTGAVPDPLPALDLSMSAATATLAVEKERRIELFTEFGHRWFDLKRTGRANDVLGISKPLVWNKKSLLFPIPLKELRLNPALVQTEGY